MGLTCLENKGRDSVTRFDSAVFRHLTGLWRNRQTHPPQKRNGLSSNLSRPTIFVAVAQLAEARG